MAEARNTQQGGLCALLCGITTRRDNGGSMV